MNPALPREGLGYRKEGLGEEENLKRDEAYGKTSFGESCRSAE